MSEEDVEGCQPLLPVHNFEATIVFLSDDEGLQTVKSAWAVVLDEGPDVVQELDDLELRPPIAALIGGNPIARRGAIVVDEKSVD
jgi:hypothetical protein